MIDIASWYSISWIQISITERTITITITMIRIITTHFSIRSCGFSIFASC